LVRFGHQAIATVPQNSPYVVYTDEHGQVVQLLLYTTLIFLML